MADRLIWSEPEVEQLIQIVRDNNIVQALNKSRFRNGDIYNMIQPLLESAGYHRTKEQIRGKWKSLQSAYRKAKTTNIKTEPGTPKFHFFDQLDQVMGSQSPLLLAEGVDSGSEVLVDVRDFNDLRPGQRSSPTADDGSADSAAPRGITSRKRRNSSLDDVSRHLADATAAFERCSRTFTAAMAAEFEKQRKWEEKQTRIARKSNEALLQRLMGQLLKGNVLMADGTGPEKKSRRVEFVLAESGDSDSD